VKCKITNAIDKKITKSFVPFKSYRAHMEYSDVTLNLTQTGSTCTVIIALHIVSIWLTIWRVLSKTLEQLKR